MKLYINSESVVLLMNCEIPILKLRINTIYATCLTVIVWQCLLTSYNATLFNAIHLVKKVYIHFAQISTISHSISKLYVV